MKSILKFTLKQSLKVFCTLDNWYKVLFKIRVWVFLKVFFPSKNTQKKF